MREETREFMDECGSLGFTGSFTTTEWTCVAAYPAPVGAPWSTEMQKAKKSAQFMTTNCGMGIISLSNETFQSGKVDWDVTLLRNTFQVDPISPAQPQPLYYAFRTLSTALDGFRPGEFPLEITAESELNSYTFRKGGRERLVAVWIPDSTTDGIVEVRGTVKLPGTTVRRAWGVDVMNGTEQELVVSNVGSAAVVVGLLIKDYPVLLRFEV